MDRTVVEKAEGRYGGGVGLRAGLPDWSCAVGMGPAQGRLCCSHGLFEGDADGF